MAIEIERKFLTASDDWLAEADEGVVMRQGYIHNSQGVTVRARIAGDAAWLTVKGPTEGIARAEFEYSIPVGDAQRMLDSMCDGPLIEKRRYRIARAPHVWEIDVFAGENEGLTLAEIELADAEEPYDRPQWLGLEVSDDERYFNAYLVNHPFRSWRA
ncbi:MAG: CYTH domain-containing protein [Gammaproteobacteria bacterium]|nr:CYTH domain-containing protein [Gammaproteobacteria bacterium]